MYLILKYLEAPKYLESCFPELGQIEYWPWVYSRCWQQGPEWERMEGGFTEDPFPVLINDAPLFQP